MYLVAICKPLQELGKSCLYKLSEFGPCGYFGEWERNLFLPTACDLLQQMVQVPGISYYLESPTSLLSTFTNHPLRGRLPVGILSLPHNAWFPKVSLEILTEASMSP